VTAGDTPGRRGARLSADGRLVRAVLFDVDGTLVDSIAFLVECFRHSAEAALGRTLGAAEVLPLVGMPLGEMYRTIRPDADEALLLHCVETYRGAYYPSVCERSPLFPDTAAVVRRLAARGLALGIVSGKNHQGIRRVLEPSGLLDQFCAVVGADHGGRGKPAPDGALAAAAMIGVPPEETLVVGDSLLDVEMGLAAGMATVGVTTGTTGRDELASRATVVIGRLAELPPLLESQ
jgi:phosphoglycolate phosphatase